MSDLYNNVLNADAILSYGDKADLLVDANTLGWVADYIALDKGLIVFTNNKGSYIWNGRYDWTCAEMIIDDGHKLFQNHRYYKNIYDAFQTENEW